VSRSLVHVREATPDDLPACLQLWEGLRSVTSRTDRLFPAPSVATGLALLRSVQGDPFRRIVVADLEGADVAGMAVFTRDPLAPLCDVPAVQVSYLVVREGCRRRGVGHALMQAAVSFAEEHAVDHVLVNVNPSVRESNRFFARMGFTPMVVRRVAPVSTIRRRLGMEQRSSVQSFAMRTLRLRARAPRVPVA
jgi:ribosomal protein S18 acetylase RimI-like enzyme